MTDQIKWPFKIDIVTELYARKALGFIFIHSILQNYSVGKFSWFHISAE